METRNEPAPSHDSSIRRLAQRQLPESSRNDNGTRGSVLTDRHDEEEKEAGYGHGV
jgi:hypothetical protein